MIPFSPQFCIQTAQATARRHQLNYRDKLFHDENWRRDNCSYQDNTNFFTQDFNYDNRTDKNIRCQFSLS